MTINNPNYHQTCYGSATNYNCVARIRQKGRYNLVEHDVLIEKAGFHSQKFKVVLPIVS